MIRLKYAIEEYCRENEVSCAELARRMGVSTSSIFKWRRGYRPWKRNMDIINEVFGKDITRNILELNFREYMLRLLHAKNCNVVDIAREVGMDAHRLYYWTWGKRNPKPHEIDLITERYGTEFD